MTIPTESFLPSDFFHLSASKDIEDEDKEKIRVITRDRTRYWTTTSVLWIVGRGGFCYLEYHGIKDKADNSKVCVKIGGTRRHKQKYRVYFYWFVLVEIQAPYDTLELHHQEEYVYLIQVSPITTGAEKFTLDTFSMKNIFSVGDLSDVLMIPNT